MRPTNNGGFTVNKQQMRGSNPRPSGREASTLPPRHGSTVSKLDNFGKSNGVREIVEEDEKE